MTAVRLEWLDVFSTGPLTGNPLAVVWGAESWGAGGMQALAAELGLSETVFLLPAGSAAADARLRIFTPARELPVAGHPVVGAAWALHAAGRIPADGRVQTGAGVLAVRASGCGAEMTQPRPEPGPEVDAAEAAAACGATAAGRPAARIWSTGIPQLMVPVPDAATLEAARPDMAAVERLALRDGWVGVSLYAVSGGADGRAEARVRHFAPAAGIPEDPVTGSAAGALGACLAAAGLGADGRLDLTVLQGAGMGRPGRVEVTVAAPGGVPDRVEVGGAVRRVLEGRVLDRPGA